MKKLVILSTFVAAAMITSLQAGEQGSKSSAACSVQTKASCSASKTACSSAVSSCCSSAKTVKRISDLKGATLLVRR